MSSIFAQKFVGTAVLLVVVGGALLTSITMVHAKSNEGNNSHQPSNHDNGNHYGQLKQHHNHGYGRQDDENDDHGGNHNDQGENEDD